MCLLILIFLVEGFIIKILKTNDIIAISCIAEEGGIGAAALKLGCSQANLSRLLSDFEKKIGLKIFHRTTRSLQTTEFGELLLHRINLLLNSHDDAINLIDTYKNEPSGHITIAAPSGITLLFARHIIPLISIAYPEISISLITQQPQQKINALSSEMELCWDILFSLHTPKDEGLVARPVANFSMGFFASSSYLQNNKFEHPQEFTEHPCILLQTFGHSFNLWTYRDARDGKIKNLNVAGRYVCDHIQPAAELAKKGFGILYSPYFMVADELNAGELHSCVSQKYSSSLSAYLIYRKVSYQPYRVRVIVDVIIEYFKQKQHHQQYI